MRLPSLHRDNPKCPVTLRVRLLGVCGAVGAVHHAAVGARAVEVVLVSVGGVPGGPAQ